MAPWSTTRHTSCPQHAQMTHISWTRYFPRLVPKLGLVCRPSTLARSKTRPHINCWSTLHHLKQDRPSPSPSPVAWTFVVASEFPTEGRFRAVRLLRCSTGIPQCSRHRQRLAHHRDQQRGEGDAYNIRGAPFKLSTMSYWSTRYGVGVLWRRR